MASIETVEATNEEVAAKLRSLIPAAESIYEALTALDLRTGVVGAARRLVEKLRSTATLYESHEGPYTADERLAINAWRMSHHTHFGVLPAMSTWAEVSEADRARWRAAAVAFKGREDED